MAKQEKTWAANPKRPKSTVPELTRKRLTSLASELIEEELRTRYVKRRRKNEKFSYLVDIYTKWSRNFFDFCALYRSPDPDDRPSEFEMKFARLEYLSTGKYILSYQRHNGQWWETDRNISQSKALQIINEGGLFIP